MKNKSDDINQIVLLISNQKIPIEIFNEIISWDFIIKSPYGNSFYNAPVGWNYKEHNSLRISNHWNFISQNKKHCETINDINNDDWGIGVYDSQLRKFNIIKTYPPTDNLLRNNVDYLLYSLQIKYNKALEKSSDNRMHLNFLNKYFKTLENYLNV